MQAPTPKRPNFFRRYWFVWLGVVIGVAIMTPVAMWTWAVFPPDVLLMKEPNQADLVGTYHLTDDSKRFLHRSKDYLSVPDSTIELRADGTYSVDGIADCTFLDWGDGAGRFWSGEGTWRLDSSDYGAGYSLTIHGTSGPFTEAFYSGWVTLRGWGSDYGLEIGIGDPDNWESIRYNKE